MNEKQCYGCQKVLGEGSVSYFCNDTCKDAYWGPTNDGRARTRTVEEAQKGLMRKKMEHLAQKAMENGVDISR